MPVSKYYFDPLTSVRRRRTNPPGLDTGQAAGVLNSVTPPNPVKPPSLEDEYNRSMLSQLAKPPGAEDKTATGLGALNRDVISGAQSALSQNQGDVEDRYQNEYNKALERYSTDLQDRAQAMKLQSIGRGTFTAGGELDTGLSRAYNDIYAKPLGQATTDLSIAAAQERWNRQLGALNAAQGVSTAQSQRELAAAQEARAYTEGEKERGLKEGELSLRGAEVAGGYYDADGNWVNTEQARQFNIGAYGEDVGRTSALPGAGGGAAGTAGKKTLAQQNLEFQQALDRARVTGTLVDPVTGKDVQTLEAELARGQAAETKREFNIQQYGYDPGDTTTALPGAEGAAAKPAPTTLASRELDAKSADIVRRYNLDVDKLKQGQYEFEKNTAEAMRQFQTIQSGYMFDKDGNPISKSDGTPLTTLDAQKIEQAKKEFNAQFDRAMFEFDQNTGLNSRQIDVNEKLELAKLQVEQARLKLQQQEAEGSFWTNLGKLGLSVVKGVADIVKPKIPTGGAGKPVAGAAKVAASRPTADITNSLGLTGTAAETATKTIDWLVGKGDRDALLSYLMNDLGMPEADAAKEVNDKFATASAPGPTGLTTTPGQSAGTNLALTVAAFDQRGWTQEERSGYMAEITKIIADGTPQSYQRLLSYLASIGLTNPEVATDIWNSREGILSGGQVNYKDANLPAGGTQTTWKPKVPLPSLRSALPTGQAPAPAGLTAQAIPQAGWVSPLGQAGYAKTATDIPLNAQAALPVVQPQPQPQPPPVQPQPQPQPPGPPVNANTGLPVAVSPATGVATPEPRVVTTGPDGQPIYSAVPPPEPPAAIVPSNTSPMGYDIQAAVLQTMKDNPSIVPAPEQGAFLEWMKTNAPNIVTADGRVANQNDLVAAYRRFKGGATPPPQGAEPTLPQGTPISAADFMAQVEMSPGMSVDDIVANLTSRGLVVSPTDIAAAKAKQTPLPQPPQPPQTITNPQPDPGTRMIWNGEDRSIVSGGVTYTSVNGGPWTRNDSGGALDFKGTAIPTPGVGNLPPPNPSATILNQARAVIKNGVNPEQFIAAMEAKYGPMSDADKFEIRGMVNRVVDPETLARRQRVYTNLINEGRTPAEIRTFFLTQGWGEPPA